MDGASTRKVIKCTSGECSEVQDNVADERRLVISVNGMHVMSLYCTPLMIRELVTGILLTEEIARNICSDRMSIQYGDEIKVDVPADGNVNLEGMTKTSGCAGGLSFVRKSRSKGISNADIKLTFEDVLSLTRLFQRLSALYTSTGCVHSAALSDSKNILCSAEDIGRHNAVDKVIGYAVLEGISLEDKVLLTSGRLSSEIVSKCSKWGIPVLVSRAAATSLAIDIAEESGITALGFVRGGKMNIYSHPERISS